MILSIISAFISTIGFAILFHAQKKHLFACGIVGALGWAIYLLGESRNFSSVLSTFFASFMVTELSYVLARRRKTPVTIFLIAGMLPLVPGIALYRTMYALMLEDYTAAANYALLTFEIAGVIAGAIVIVSVLPSVWKKKRTKKTRCSLTKS